MYRYGVFTHHGHMCAHRHTCSRRSDVLRSSHVLVSAVLEDLGPVAALCPNTAHNRYIRHTPKTLSSWGSLVAERGMGRQVLGSGPSSELSQSLHKEALFSSQRLPTLWVRVLRQTPTLLLSSQGMEYCSTFFPSLEEKGPYPSCKGRRYICSFIHPVYIQSADIDGTSTVCWYQGES